ncbi:phytase [Streptomyces sp. NPDC005752]|uniref:phytase n=1 Tax=Streptomyces sp. NPDC005752 TaxID=3157065 RepID=UPI0033EC5F39
MPSVGATAELYDDEAGGNADADDPAIWRDDAHPGRSLVVATAKEGGLRVYGLDASLSSSSTCATCWTRRTSSAWPGPRTASRVPEGIA